MIHRNILHFILFFSLIQIKEANCQSYSLKISAIKHSIKTIRPLTKKAVRRNYTIKMKYREGPFSINFDSLISILKLCPEDSSNRRQLDIRSRLSFRNKMLPWKKEVFYFDRFGRFLYNKKVYYCQNYYTMILSLLPGSYIH